VTALTALHARGAGFQAAQLLYQSTLSEISIISLYDQISFGTKPHRRAERLEECINLGWLARTHVGWVRLGDAGAAFFRAADIPVKREPLGQVATSRASSAYDRPPLSRKFIPNARGTRDDVPAFSVRIGAHFHTQA
jgi:hypothetical protein